jgi:beta-glucosidase
VQDGHVAEVMCAYQRIDGDPCCGNTRYLQHILRDEWGFKGLVTSDCGAVDDFWKPGRHGVSKDAPTASAKAVRSGTDVECGSNYRTLPEALAAGEISEQEIDVSLIRLLQARFELGDFDGEELVEWQRMPESKLLSKANKQLALDMARESITLLQNRGGILPLSERGQKILVMGPNANDSVMQWANYYGYPTKTSTILEGISQIAGEVDFYGCCGLTRNEVQESRFNEISHEGKAGMKATYYNNRNFKGEPAAVRYLTEPIQQSNGGNTVFAPGVNLEKFSVRYEGTFIPTHTEDLILNMAFDDGVRLIVNGDTLINVWTGRNRVQFGNKPLHVEAGKVYKIQIDYQQDTDMAVMIFDLFHKYVPSSEDIIKATEGYEVVVFVGGISPRLEGEEMKVSEPGFKGGDRTDIELPQAQRDVLTTLHKAGRKIVYVNCSGSAIALEPETVNCDAILQAWYPGEAGGQAVAEVLFGRYNPSGKLPITFYRHVSDLPDFLDYRMQGRTYRYFEGDALFPFGYGLSYTTFEISDVKYKKGKLSATIKNTGKKKGSETVQVYFKRPDDKNGPIKTLCDYKKVILEPGESQNITFEPTHKQLESWDSKSNTMRFVPGKYELMVGSSSLDKDLKRINVKLK